MDLNKEATKIISQDTLVSLLETGAKVAEGSFKFAEEANTPPGLSKDTAAIIIQLNNLIQMINVQNIIIAKGINGSKQ